MISFENTLPLSLLSHTWTCLKLESQVPLEKFPSRQNWKVTLSWNSLQLSFLSKLSSLVHLESLVLSYCVSITDRTLYSVSFPSSLQYLNLDNCSVTDSGINELFKLPNLRKVHLVGTSVSFSKLQELAKKCGSQVSLPKWWLFWNFILIQMFLWIVE
jgi:hypothetical protein